MPPRSVLRLARILQTNERHDRLQARSRSRSRLATRTHSARRSRGHRRGGEWRTRCVIPLSLERADALRYALVAWAHSGHGAASIVVVLAAAFAAALAAWLVARFSPEASGSGIPHVEAVLHGKAPPASLILIPVKFVGGVLAIGAGLALGREGPTVQMGASIAHRIGTLLGRSASDRGVLLAAAQARGSPPRSMRPSRARCSCSKN